MFMRAQAALEYLLTYGLAIIIVLIILGILVMYVPRRPERCDVRAPFLCDTMYVYVDARSGNLTIRFTNTAPVEYRIRNTTCGGNTFVYPGDKRIWPGEYGDVYFNCSGRTKPDATPGKDFFDDEVTMSVIPTGGIAPETVRIKITKYYP